MKKPLTLDRIFIEEPTKSILNLLYELPKGLRPIHIRYALEENLKKKGSNDSEYKSNVNRAEEIFGSRLSQFEKRGLITKGCIKGREHLHYYLNLLVEPGENKLNVVKKIGYGKTATYKLKKGFFRELFRFRCKQTIYLYPSDSVQEFRDKDNELFRHYIFGLPTSWCINLGDSDKKVIETNLSEVGARLREIQKIKLDAICIEVEKRLQQFYQSTTSENIKKLLKEFPQTFYIGVAELSKFHTLNKESVADLWEDLFGLYERKKHYPDNTPEVDILPLLASWSYVKSKLTDQEIEEILEWERQNRDLLEEAHPISISYFWYNYGDIKFYRS